MPKRVLHGFSRFQSWRKKRSHACLTAHLTYISSCTNQYQRVAATSGSKDALITAVERSLHSVQTTATSQRCWHLSHCWRSLRACRRRTANLPKNTASLPKNCKRAATSLPYRRRRPKRAHAAAASAAQRFKAKTHSSDTCASPTPARRRPQRRTRALLRR